jgi:putative transposase
VFPMVRALQSPITKGNTMNAYESLSHTKWECKYHVVFIPKYRRKALFGELRKHIGEIFHELARQRESKIEEGHLMPDHVHILIAIPPKYSVSEVMGFMKGKSAIHIARTFIGKRRNFVGQHFWARGYMVSTVGKDEAAVRKYIQEQEKEDQRLDQMEMFKR